MPQGLQFGQSSVASADLDRRVLGTHLDEVYDRVFLSPVCATGTSTVGRLGSRHPMQSFPDGSTTGCTWAFPVRDNWTNHYLRVTGYFASDVGSTNTFDIRVAAFAFGSTVALTNGRTIGDTTASYAGPAAATTELSFSLNLATSPVTVQTDWSLCLLVQRIGATDANNNVLYLLGLLVEAYRA